jgi:hypothetical protein
MGRKRKKLLSPKAIGKTYRKASANVQENLATSTSSGSHVDVCGVRLHEPCDPMLNPQSIYLTQFVVTASQKL